MLRHTRYEIKRSLQYTIDSCITEHASMILMPPHTHAIKLPDHVVGACMPVKAVHVLSYPHGKVFSWNAGHQERVTSVGRIHPANLGDADREPLPDCSSMVTVSNLRVQSRLGLKPYPMIFHTGRPFAFWHQGPFSLGIIGLECDLNIRAVNVRAVSQPILIQNALGNVITATKEKLELNPHRWARIMETGQIGELVGSSPWAMLGCQVETGQHLELIEITDTPGLVEVVDEDELSNGIGSWQGVTWNGQCGGEKLPRHLRLDLE